MNLQDDTLPRQKLLNFSHVTIKDNPKYSIFNYQKYIYFSVCI
jgi:hypothetical protein